jgi:2-polyprenyl-3-methyl-5-hydroxy-6-metoxy-1,4-benzoquinol methylase
MTINYKRIQKESTFYDEFAAGVTLDDEMVRERLRCDSPAPTYGNRLPRLKSSLRHSLGDVKGSRVLVYGCGTDSAALWFAKEGALVDAIDISQKCIEFQRVLSAKSGLTVNARIMDAHNLDFPSDTYDIVYGNAILHHLSVEKAATECSRVLKPGGKAVFRDVMKGNVFLQLFRRATPFWRTPDERPLTREDFTCFHKSFQPFKSTSLF